MPRNELQSQPFVVSGVIALSAIAGILFPDFDLKLTGILEHRSIVTHGCLLPLALWMADYYAPRRFMRACVIGFCATLAVHLCFDLFPRGWAGYALIHVPFYGRLPAALSWLWIAGNIVLCVYLVESAIATAVEIVIAGAGALIAFYLSAHEGIWWPLAFVIVELVEHGKKYGQAWVSMRHAESVKRHENSNKQSRNT